MTTIQVTPRRTLVNTSTGQEASAYGACPPGFALQTKGYTWEINRNGRITVGICRTPVDTLEEANKVAESVAVKCNMTVVYG